MLRYNGFWEDLENLRDELRPQGYEPDWGFLENEAHYRIDNPESGYGVCPFDFLHGECNVFAQYLNRKYRYPIECVYEDGNLVHAYNVIKTDRDTLYMDIRGYISNLDAFMAEFYDSGLWRNDDGTTYGRYEKADDMPETIFCTETAILDAAAFMDKEYDYWDISAYFIKAA